MKPLTPPQRRALNAAQEYGWITGWKGSVVLSQYQHKGVILSLVRRKLLAIKGGAYVLTDAGKNALKG